MLNRYQFRISTLLAVVTIFALAAIIVQTRLELNRVKTQLASQSADAAPISSAAVSASVMRYISDHPLPTQVREVRYNSADDTFRVRYAWTNPSDNQSFSSTVKLVGDGYGVYTGCITNASFLAPIQPPRYKPPLAKGDGLWVSVATAPSP